MPLGVSKASKKHHMTKFELSNKISIMVNYLSIKTHDSYIILCKNSLQHSFPGSCKPQTCSLSIEVPQHVVSTS
jgi:hypothetical protein